MAVLILIGMLLGISQRFRIDDIELDMVATELEVSTNQTRQFPLVFLVSEQGRHHAHVEQCASTLGLVEFA